MCESHGQRGRHHTPAPGEDGAPVDGPHQPAPDVARAQRAAAAALEQLEVRADALAARSRAAAERIARTVDAAKAPATDS